MGIIANVFAGLVGAYAGQSLLGSWGPSIAEMALLPSIVCRCSDCDYCSVILYR